MTPREFVYGIHKLLDEAYGPSLCRLPPDLQLWVHPGITYWIMADPEMIRYTAQPRTGDHYLSGMFPVPVADGYRELQDGEWSLRIVPEIEVIRSGKVEMA